MLLATLFGCITLTVEPLPPTTSVEDCAGCVANDLTGEVLAFVNGKLTDPAAAYTANAVHEDGAVLAASIFLYDPARPGELVKWGNVDLGENLLGDDAKEQTTFQELAWDAEGGLWGLAIDYINDEWLLVEIEVPDPAGADQRLPGTIYAFRTTDPISWEPARSGMMASGGALILGGRADAGGGPGRLFRSALPTGWSVDPAYPEDPEFYSDAQLTEAWLDFPEGLGVAGDLASGDPLGLEALMTARAERSSAGDLDENRLFGAGEGIEDLGLAFDVVRNRDVEGLALIDGALWGVDTEAVIWRFDLETGEAEAVDDLSGLLADPDDGVRIRGAAGVTL